ncbi:MAG: D-alanyl-D-alanine carboxypeptidase/D-alanyl-D-alanine-endopeptidase [Bacteroidetes bacterium GWF2_41_61]|jgi:D-alanyl-D-alanine carboxypeptidase/D-alanyl-D-alanine-endopeptidase (penicillin-binding protein 4)|nr:MAG: D-alanyl-D-alanine carboxypeptidase/D-alanyl-D-alanine-endopeptidase [Bacteroidetes bacterium GWE2_40_15]OFY34707.1 MAG: D-alanyl-D-alanine carboxypeptidase/D-alanyl-D-alanine-endopeptidase [Bacteroidetes bacterium GWF2_41_61]OFY90682.1 MAG: D-alanyl-D-alanine carboxypeptidase/D-alanyl-D-alanine-endopeptidase [Bacteroidetes bacterium RIFOXYA12_FULL_40_10]PKP06297.1 MAG: D-alanyl-D-alanine carboxypeptidase/D-alanyl-D-alanine-endopeptidase [Bacteroidetes bacterium HGW-Bacteroidetes-5]HBG2
MKQILRFLLILITFLSPLSLSSQSNNIQNYIGKLKKDTLFTDAVVGIMVMDSRGKSVASWNPDMPLLTASTMKTITTGVALNLLGADFRFSTKIGYSGEIRNGVLYGDLYIVGGGDPTLGSSDTLAIPVENLFLQWRDAIAAAGIRRINGHIVADDRFFEPEIVPESWSWSNLGPAYGSGVSGLSFYENLQKFKFIPGINPGDRVSLMGVYPEIPGMEYRNELTTGDVKSGNRSSYYISDLAKISQIKGTLAAGSDSISITFSNKFPHLSCAWEFRQYLLKSGIISDSKIKDAREFNSLQPYQLTIVAETLSPALSSIVNVTNRISNNFYAETLLKMIGKRATGVGSYDSARVALRRELDGMGIKKRGFTQSDGSGLSRQNYVSARFFCNYFSKMRESSSFTTFFNSLPQPGGPGTLKSVLANEQNEKKTRIHAKSGSLGNVRCYAGYVERDNGELIYFAILANNFSARTAQMQIGIEGFMRELINY